MPIDATGFTPESRADIVTALEAEHRARISAKAILDESTAMGNVLQIYAGREDLLQQILHEAYNAFDPDNATDDRFVALALATGTPRRGATHGVVTAQLDLEASQSFAAGDLVAHVTGEPANRWVNRDAVVSTTAGEYDAVFESEDPGAQATAQAGTLTVIPSAVAGWNAIDNDDAATPGADIETIDALRVRRELSLSAAGSRTRGAIQARLNLLDGVISARVFENTGDTTDADGIPPHSVRCVVWDGPSPAADDDDIAQAIYDTKAEGIRSEGNVTGTAQDTDLGPQVVSFRRATASTVTFSVTIESEDGVAITDIEDAILAAMPTQPGEPVIYNRLSAAVFEVAGVDDWSVFTINGGTADLPAVQSTIFVSSAASITVLGDVA